MEFPAGQLHHCSSSYDENTLFENALEEIDLDFFAWNQIDEISHCQTSIQDLSMIQTANIPDPSPSNEAQTSNSKPCRRGIPWTEEEHQLFLMGLSKYGKGNWRSISRYYVTSKTPTQVASHAQKYFRREKCKTPLHKRRPSIHDIRTVNPAPQPEININYELDSCGLVNPMLLYKGFGGGLIEQTAMFSSINDFASPSDYPQASAGLNVLPNQQWCSNSSKE